MKRPIKKKSQLKQLEQHIWIAGEINYELAKAFFATLAECRPGVKLVANICSGGGDVEVGYAIHDALRTWPWGCTTVGFGMVGSIAAVIFCAGEERLLSPNTMILIHPMSAEFGGTVRQIGQTYDSLRKAHERMVGIIGARCLSPGIVASWADDETYLTPEVSLECGLATGIIQFSNK